MSRNRFGATVATVALGAAVATALAVAHGGDTALIHACVSNSTGDARIVGPDDACRSSERPVDWNQQGEAGRDGRDGRDGAAGSSVVAPRAVGTVSLTGAIQGPIEGGADGNTVAMEIIAFEHEIVSPRDAASGLPTGKRQHKPITIVKVVDAATPLLLHALARNETLTEVVVRLDRAGDEAYLVVKLTNASIASWSPSSSAHTDTQELEKISFTYQKIELEHVPTRRVAEDDWAAPDA